MGLRSSLLSLEDRNPRIALQAEGDTCGVPGIIQYRDHMVTELARQHRRAEPRPECLGPNAGRPGVGVGARVAYPSPANDLLRHDRLEADAQPLLLGDPIGVLNDP